MQYRIVNGLQCCWHSPVRDVLREPGVNGYVREVSNGRFMWARAGVISMNFTAHESGSNFTPESMEFGQRRLMEEKKP